MVEAPVQEAAVVRLRREYALSYRRDARVVPAQPEISQRAQLPDAVLGVVGPAERLARGPRVESLHQRAYSWVDLHRVVRGAGLIARRVRAGQVQQSIVNDP